jgi:hypothetical protein
MKPEPRGGDEAATVAPQSRRSTRVEGLVDLLADGVVQGARLVERAHRGVTGRHFWLLKQLPLPYAEAPVKVVEAVHDAHLTLVYGSIRGVARAVQVVTSAALASSGGDAPARSDDDAPTPSS